MHTTNFMFDAIVKGMETSLLPRDMCNRHSGVTDRLEFVLCEALYTEVVTVPTPFYTQAVSQPLRWKHVELLGGVWVSAACHTTREELS